MDARKVSMRSDVSKNLKDDEVFTIRFEFQDRVRTTTEARTIFSALELNILFAYSSISRVILVSIF